MKVKRNDVCPCGSGKKFKKCCERRNRLEGRVSLPQQQKTTSFFNKAFANITIQLPIPEPDKN